MQYACNPNELLCEDACKRDVDPAENEGHNKHKSEENNSVRVQAKTVAVIVYSTSCEVGIVAIECDTGNRNESSEYD